MTPRVGGKYPKKLGGFPVKPGKWKLANLHWVRALSVGPAK
jgi:hypothetical protein